MNPDPIAPSIRGIAYPLRVENGNLATSVDYQLIAQQIRSVIETRFFERVMRADYGVDDYTLSILNPGQINSDFRRAVISNVPVLSNLDVQGDWLTEGEDGIYRVSILYSVNGVPQPPLQFSLAN